MAQFAQLLKPGLYGIRSGIMQKNWVLSVDQCQLEAFAVFSASHQFAERASQMKWFHWDSESCSGPEGSRPPDSGQDLFWCKFGFGKWFGAS